MATRIELPVPRESSTDPQNEDNTSGPPEGEGNGCGQRGQRGLVALAEVAVEIVNPGAIGVDRFGSRGQAGGVGTAISPTEPTWLNEENAGQGGGEDGGDNGGDNGGEETKKKVPVSCGNKNNRTIEPRNCQYQRSALLQNDGSDSGLSQLERFLAEKELELTIESVARVGAGASASAGAGADRKLSLQPRNTQYQPNRVHETEGMLDELEKLLAEKARVRAGLTNGPLQPRTLQYEENTLLETKDDQVIRSYVMLLIL